MAAKCAAKFTGFAMDAEQRERVTAVCIGTGRFLRAVLVPSLLELGCEVVIVQTRGTSFDAYLEARGECSYEVDTVMMDGAVETSTYQLAASGSLGTPEGRAAFMALAEGMPALRYIGVGLTEAGICHNGQSILDLAEFLHRRYVSRSAASAGRLSVINTDNLPSNGDHIAKYILACDYTQALPEAEEFERWLRGTVVFHNTMVDRITSHRDGDTMTPRAEPLPAKSLVIEDLEQVLPRRFESLPGVKLRCAEGDITSDHQLKLRIANGLHTAMVYVMALSHLFKTDRCIGHPLVLPLLEQLYERDIVHMCAELQLPRSTMAPVYGEWVSRLQHPHFGLACFFVSQNAHTKLSVRLVPSVLSTLASGHAPSDFMVFVVAVLLRFLTPIGPQPRLADVPPVFRGRLDAAPDSADIAEPFEYVPGMGVDPAALTYDFKDGDGTVPLLLRPLGLSSGGASAAAAVSIVGDVLTKCEGFNAMASDKHAAFATRVGTMLHRMLRGERAMAVLASLSPSQPIALSPSELREAVEQEVAACSAVDLHTHLLPPTHGEAMLWGIDRLLTWHYLISEYSVTMHESADELLALPRAEQASRVWRRLFVDRTPMSEACRGVLTVLHSLGLHEEVRNRDLEAIRSWYASQDATQLSAKCLRHARVSHAYMSNDAFDAEEMARWRQLGARAQPPAGYRSALCVDQLLEGDWEALCQLLEAAGRARSEDGCVEHLKDCAKLTGATFLSLAVPHDYALEAGGADKLQRVALRVCEELGVPLALRIGTRRALNPALRLAGDGVGTADVALLHALCSRHPKMKFLATFLSRVNQHEAAVTASKFPNLHLYGCWWYCNIPSIVEETTRMRLELLGTAFSAQTSSARVTEQLISKWMHARATLTDVLASKYADVMATGWLVSRADVRRDAAQLLGGAFEDFMAKKL